MSFAPQTLIDLRRFLAEETGREAKNFSIRGTCGTKRVWGFHLGKDDIFSSTCGRGNQDYSIQHRRNKLGLTNASAGFDIRLPKAQLKRLCAYLVKRGQEGWRDPSTGKTLLFEVIGPDATGAAKRWAKDTGWKPTKGSADHEWHIHLGFWRDTESIDKRPLFFEFFDLAAAPVEPDQPDEPVEPLPPAPGEPEPPTNPEPPEIDPVQLELDEARDLIDDIEAMIGAYRQAND